MGDIIFSEGEIGNEMFIIQSGTVELLKTIGKDTKVLATLEKGDFFGEMSVLEDLPAHRLRPRQDRTWSSCASTAPPSTRC